MLGWGGGRWQAASGPMLLPPGLYTHLGIPSQVSSQSILGPNFSRGFASTNRPQVLLHATGRAWGGLGGGGSCRGLCVLPR